MVMPEDILTTQAPHPSKRASAISVKIPHVACGFV
jgi:hypothetical protein